MKNRQDTQIIFIHEIYILEKVFHENVRWTKSDNFPVNVHVGKYGRKKILAPSWNQEKILAPLF